MDNQESSWTWKEWKWFWNKVGWSWGGCWLALVQAKFTFVGWEEWGTGVDGLVRWP